MPPADLRELGAAVHLLPDGLLAAAQNSFDYDQLLPDGVVLGAGVGRRRGVVLESRPVLLPAFRAFIYHNYIMLPYRAPEVKARPALTPKLKPIPSL